MRSLAEQAKRSRSRLYRNTSACAFKRVAVWLGYWKCPPSRLIRWSASKDLYVCQLRQIGEQNHVAVVEVSRSPSVLPAIQIVPWELSNCARFEEVAMGSKGGPMSLFLVRNRVQAIGKCLPAGNEVIAHSACAVENVVVMRKGSCCGVANILISPNFV